MFLFLHKARELMKSAQKPTIIDNQNYAENRPFFCRKCLGRHEKKMIFKDLSKRLTRTCRLRRKVLFRAAKDAKKT